LEQFCIPSFLLPHAADILTAGKTLRLLLTLEQVFVEYFRKQLYDLLFFQHAHDKSFLALNS
jgi:hypothetical protein